MAKVTEEKGPDVTNYVNSKVPGKKGKGRELHASNLYDEAGILHKESELESHGLQGFQTPSRYSGQEKSRGNLGFRGSQKFQGIGSVSQGLRESVEAKSRQFSQSYQSAQKHKTSKGYPTSGGYQRSQNHKVSEGYEAISKPHTPQTYQAPLNSHGSQNYQTPSKPQSSQNYQTPLKQEISHSYQTPSKPHGYQAPVQHPNSQGYHAPEKPHSSQNYQAPQEHDLQSYKSSQELQDFQSYKTTQGHHVSQSYQAPKVHQISQSYKAPQEHQSSQGTPQFRTYQIPQEIYSSGALLTSQLVQDSGSYQDSKKSQHFQSQIKEQASYKSHDSKNEVAAALNGKLSQHSFDISSFLKNQVPQKSHQSYQKAGDQGKRPGFMDQNQVNLGLLNQKAIFVNANAIQKQTGYNLKPKSSMYDTQPIYKKKDAFSILGKAEQSTPQTSFKTLNTFPNLELLQATLKNRPGKQQSISDVYSSGDVGSLSTFGLKLSSSKGLSPAKAPLNANIIGQHFISELANAQQSKSSYTDHGNVHSQDKSSGAVQTSSLKQLSSYGPPGKFDNLQGLKNNIKLLPMRIVGNKHFITSQVVNPQLHIPQPQQGKKQNQQPRITFLDLTSGSLALNQNKLKINIPDQQTHLGFSHDSGKSQSEIGKTSPGVKEAKTDFVLSNSYLPPPPAGNAGILKIEGESYELPHF